jgi:hypothetical protein
MKKKKPSKEEPEEPSKEESKEEKSELEKYLENSEEERISLQPIEISDTTLKPIENQPEKQIQENPVQDLEEGVSEGGVVSRKKSGREMYEVTPTEEKYQENIQYNEERTHPIKNSSMIIQSGSSIDLDSFRGQDFQRRTNFQINPELQEFENSKNPEEYVAQLPGEVFRRDEFSQENRRKNLERKYK